jgi:glycosyltransferase involved in cell wall biosynthesis
MIRICSSLALAGFDVLLVGRKKTNSPNLQEKSFRQKRLYCFAQKGKWFYIEYNIRLFFYLLFVKTDCFTAIDLDTILPNLWASQLRRKKRVYDAHELFCEMEEIISRPRIYKIWKKIESYAVPKFRDGYTIGNCYQSEFKRLYKNEYEIVRNATVLNKGNSPNANKKKHVFYQGAVNEGRCFETLIPAMKQVDAQLIICGNGNFMDQAKDLVKEHKLENKVIFKGYIPPEQLKEHTRNAYVGLTLFQETGMSNYYSMANRFFDYMHFCVPQITVNFPEYQRVNEQFEIAVLVDDTKVDTLANAMKEILENDEYHAQLVANCFRAREAYNWQHEEKRLVNFYNTLFG